MRTAPVIVAVLLPWQAQAGEVATFNLTAYVEPAMDPADRTPLVRDARTRLPKLLRMCGIRQFHSVPVTDGAVVYQFLGRSSSSEVACVRNGLPKGARLDS